MRQCESIIKLEYPLGVTSQTLVNLSSFQDITRFWRREAVDRIGCRVQTDDHRWYGVCVWPFHIRHMLFNTTSSTLYFVTNFGLCLSRPWGYSEVSFGINERIIYVTGAFWEDRSGSLSEIKKSTIYESNSTVHVQPICAGDIHAVYRRVLQSVILAIRAGYGVFIIPVLQRKAMVRDIYIKDPDGDQDFDGYEETEDIEDILQREWEASTLNW